MALVVLCSRFRNVHFVCGSSVCFPGAAGISIPGYSKLTFNCEKHSVPKKHLTKQLEDSCKKRLTESKDELAYTVDSLTGDSCSKVKRKAVKVGVEACAWWWVWAVVTAGDKGKRFSVTQEAAGGSDIGRGVCIACGWVMQLAGWQHSFPQPVMDSIFCVFPRRQVHPGIKSG